MNHSIFIGRKVSDTTRNWLLKNNICFEEHQLIQIELNKPDLAEFESIKNESKQFVITSQWAAKWLLKYYRKIGVRKQDSIYCLSEKQKLILKDVADDIFVSDQKNARSLADLVIKRYHSGIVIFLHGNQSVNENGSGRAPFYSIFKSIGVYQNFPVPEKIDKEFNLYVFFSPSGVRSFNHSGNIIPASAGIVAIGETTAKACKTLFTNRVFVSEKQDELSVIQFAIEQTKQMLIA